MQLRKITGLHPLTILAAATLTTTTEQVYADIDQNSNISSIVSNNITSKYLNDIEENSYSVLISRKRFEKYFTNWQNETFFLSSSEQIINNENFKGIVSLGVKAVPFIIEEIERKPSVLVWALNFIYNKKISNNPNTTITEACKLWVKNLKN